MDKDALGWASDAFKAGAQSAQSARAAIIEECATIVEQGFAHGLSPTNPSADLASRIRALASSSDADVEAENERKREECIGRNLPANWKP